jgi:hypothetical protein
VCVYTQHSVTHAVIEIDGERATSEAQYFGFHTIAAEEASIASFFGPV